MPESPNDDERQDGNAEAAKWRRRLRDTEAERDTLAATVAEIQRAQIAALLEREHVTIDALTALGATLTDLLDSDGRVDTDKVRSAAEAARAALGISVHAGLYVPAEGTIPPPPKSGSFSDAFAPRSSR